MHQLFIAPADKYIPSDMDRAFERLPSDKWHIAPFSLQSWRDPDPDHTILLHFGGIRLREEGNADPGIELAGTNVTLDQLLQFSGSRDMQHQEAFHTALLIVILFGAEPNTKIALAISRLLKEKRNICRVVHLIIVPVSDAPEDTTADGNSRYKQLSMLATVISRDFSIGELLQLYPDALHLKISDPIAIRSSSPTPESLPPLPDVHMPMQKKNPLTAWLKNHFLRQKNIRRKTEADASTELGHLMKEARRFESVRTSKPKEDVNCTLFAPKTVVPSNEFMVQVFVHAGEQKALLEEMARITDPAASLGASTELDELITPGTRLTLQLSISSMIIEEPVLQLKWKGNISAVQFTVKVPADAPPSDVIGKVLVLKDSVPIGVLKFKICIGTRAGTANEQVQSGMKHFKKAFISYASQDRAEVLRRVQMLNLIQLPFFQDLLTLEAGDQWEPQIFKNIADSDVFFLFWSKAASASQWVRKEVLYARELQSKQELPEIIPVIIEGPPVIAPPEELAFMHFNDKMIYFIHAEQ